jgi:hypothetical protein
MNTPKEITLDTDTGIHVASFSYYDGVKYVKDNGLKQTTSFRDVFAGTHFIICCGDVMVVTSQDKWPDIKRREI